MVPQPIRNPVSQQAIPRLPMVQQPIASTTIESYQTSSIPVMSTSRNLITVPIQEEQYRHPGAFPAPIGAVPGGFPGQVNPLAPMQQFNSSAQVSSSQYPPQISMAGAHFTTAGVPHPHHVPPPQIMSGQNQPRFSSPHQPFDDKHPPQFNQPGGSPRLPWNSGSRPPGPVPPTQRPHGENSSYNQYY
ncbi:hypothetical protein LOTGIDRAFT_172925 [Lottia gigantea]|uniref:Uncharacterized protein n=1 Tax=Lottia gigantea TaxID=225164 RepID=V4AUJ9_LOTGI|nr:hypothetical protein LOTGIDRAFT_172925 [Lottia gigantea]ESP00993.1 hypothetical protein LOTGIDRAFT_172925 [Lottia gigantea]